MARKNKNGERPCIMLDKGFLKLCYKQLRKRELLGQLFEMIIRHTFEPDFEPEFDEDNPFDYVVSALYENFVESDESDKEGYSEKCKASKISRLIGNAKERKLNKSQVVQYMAEKGITDIDDYIDQLKKFEGEMPVNWDDEPEQSEPEQEEPEQEEPKSKTETSQALKDWWKDDILPTFPKEKRGKHIRGELVKQLHDEYETETLKQAIELYYHSKDDYTYLLGSQKFFEEGVYKEWVDLVLHPYEAHVSMPESFKNTDLPFE